MSSGGDCLTCAKLGQCSVTNLQRVLTGFWCPLFLPVVEPIFLARVEMMRKYGDTAAVEAMLGETLPNREGEEEDV